MVERGPPLRDNVFPTTSFIDLPRSICLPRRSHAKFVLCASVSRIGGTQCRFLICDDVSEVKFGGP
jgi:hypothetical protein